jgi:hypothetical protein
MEPVETTFHKRLLENSPDGHAADGVRTFRTKIDADLEGYWTARRQVTSDDIAIRLEMAGYVIDKLVRRIVELEKKSP